MKPLLNNALEGDNLDKVAFINALVCFTSLTLRVDSVHLNLFDLFKKGDSVFWATWDYLPRIRRFAGDFTNRGEHEASRGYRGRVKGRWGYAKIQREDAEWEGKDAGDG